MKVPSKLMIDPFTNIIQNAGKMVNKIIEENNKAISLDTKNRQKGNMPDSSSDRTAPDSDGMSQERLDQLEGNRGINDSTNGIPMATKPLDPNVQPNFQDSYNDIAQYWTNQVDGFGGFINDVSGRTAAQAAENVANLQMWQLNNMYNSPAEQMKRYTDAGLNPNLIYGQGQAASAGNSSAAPKASSSQGGLQTLTSAASMLFGIGKTQAEISNIAADTQNKRIEKDLIKANIKVQEETARKIGQDINESMKRIDKMQGEIDYTKAQKVYQDYLNSTTDIDTAIRLADVDQKTAAYLETMARFDTEIQNRETQIEMQEYYRTLSQKNLSDIDVNESNIRRNSVGNMFTMSQTNHEYYKTKQTIFDLNVSKPLEAYSQFVANNQASLDLYLDEIYGESDRYLNQFSGDRRNDVATGLNTGLDKNTGLNNQVRRMSRNRSRNLDYQTDFKDQIKFYLRK